MEVLRLVTPTHPAAAPLLTGLNAYSGFEFLPPAGAFIVLESDGMTLAGGALRRLGPGVGEITHMWTAPEHRGRGYAQRVQEALEAAALRRGYHTVRLETGDEKRLDGADHLAADELDRREIVVREMLEHHTLYTRLGKAA
jgi:GNAT superfamily N-acetyltransferase